MGGLSPPLLDHIVQGLAADLVGALELAGGEVAGGVGAGLVDDVDERVCTELGKGAAGLGHVMAADRFPEDPGCFPERVFVMVLDGGRSAVVYHDRLQAL